MKKISIVLITLILLVLLNVKTVKAESKADMPYEIHNIRINKNNKSLEIDGWAFITDAQHFLGDSTHEVYIILNENDHQIKTKAKLKHMSHTQHMQYSGSKWCGNNEFNKEAIYCNNFYENVGFVASIPLSELKVNKEYKASINVKAKQASVSKTVNIHFPQKDIMILREERMKYVIDSKLNNFAVEVMFNHVLLKDKPGPSGNIINSTLECSTDPNLYFQKNNIFYNVFDYKLESDNLTYYKLSAKQADCFLDFPLVKEGSEIFPVWIASKYIDFRGRQLTIQTSFENSPPEIFINNHPTIYVDEEIDFMNGVTATDLEDGDISSKIIIESNNFKNTPGHYKVEFSVTDSDGAITYASKNIIVIKSNFPPIINAEDVEIKQYSNFDPYSIVTAVDQDMNNITDKVKTTTTVDTSVLGIQNQCYTVTDQYNLTTNKCINVTVVKENVSFRFISKNNLFYKEAIPSIWIDHIARLKQEVSNDIVHIKRNISK